MKQSSSRPAKRGRASGAGAMRAALGLSRSLRSAMADPSRRAAAARALGLREEALHALHWARWSFASGGWTLGFGEGCAGRELPRWLLAEGATSRQAARSVRSTPGRLQLRSVSIRNRTLDSGTGTLTALLRSRDERSGSWYALTAGHVLASDLGSSASDHVQLGGPPAGLRIDARLAEWAPTVFDARQTTSVDAAIARLGRGQMLELLDLPVELPQDVASLQPAPQRLELRTRDSVIAAVSDSFGVCWMDIDRTGDRRDYQLVEGMFYEPQSPTVGGDSGAPLWDEHQRLVAMHIGRGPEDQPGLSVAVPFGYVWRALDGWQCEVMTRGMPFGPALARFASDVPAATALPVVPARPRPVPAQPAAPVDVGATVDTLARTMWGEARGESDRAAGMSAVACVVLNRVKRQTYWGRSVREVCRKPFQFSCWNEGDPNRARLLAVRATDAVFSLALRIAAEAVAGQLVDATRGATHYHASSLRQPPKWARGKTPCAVIGNHRFFNDVR